MRVIASARIPGGANSRAEHTVDGVPVSSAFWLRIIQFEGEEGMYLIRYGVDQKELTDTLHDTLSAAMDQAEFEYGTTPGDWQFEQAMLKS
jgi:hypothetical protein